MNRKPVVPLAAAALAAFLILSLVPGPGIAPAAGVFGEDSRAASSPVPGVRVVAENLRVPWEIAFLPDGRMIVTERPGTLAVVDGRGVAARIPVPGVEHAGEGGLMGLALHPDFKSNQWLYLCFTAREDGRLVNRVERHVFDGRALSERKAILTGIPGASFHDGGRIAFGPDRLLYVTTGDAGNSDLAQDKGSLAGKILRVSDDGAIPADNPFGTAVWSYGHRNAQGLAWDGRGGLWATEHGRSGFRSGLDEVNLVEKGANYGWPVIQGDETREGMKTPVRHSGPDVTWAPAGLAWLDGSLLFSGLRGRSLYRARVSGPGIVSLDAFLEGRFGRLRAVKAGPDGFLYVSTSNTDGRGSPAPDDDKILEIAPRVFAPDVMGSP